MGDRPMVGRPFEPTRLYLHYIPGHFGEGASGFFGALGRSSAAFRTSGVAARREPSSADSSGPWTWLAATAPGEARSAVGSGRVGRSRPMPLVLEAFGTAAPGRVLCAVALEISEDPGVTLKDVETGLLSVVYQALVREDQGAVVLGVDLGPVGAGISHGSVAEQLKRLLEVQGHDRILAVLTTEDTARSVGDLPGLPHRPSAGLIEYRPS